MFWPAAFLVGGDGPTASWRKWTGSRARQNLAARAYAAALASGGTRPKALDSGGRRQADFDRSIIFAKWQISLDGYFAIWQLLSITPMESGNADQGSHGLHRRLR